MTPGEQLGGEDARVVSHIRLDEPCGERTLAQRCTVGGEGAQIVVPGARAGACLRIEHRAAAWSAEPAGDAAVRLDGCELGAPRDLRLGDVLTVGDAQISVAALSRRELRLKVCHLVGNDTVAPATVLTSWEDSDADLTIAPLSDPGAAATERLTAAHAAPWRTRLAQSALLLWRHVRPRMPWLLTGAALLVAVIFLAGFRTVVLDVRPGDAQVRATDTRLALRRGDVLWLRIGTHTLRAERPGYFPAGADLTVPRESEASPVARLRLAKLPGRLRIDTGGIPATVSIDGMPRGSVPAEIDVPAGRRTVSAHAPRYLDAVAVIDVAGAEQRQKLRLNLAPAWGTLVLAASPARAQLMIDGESLGSLAPVQLMAGVHRIRLMAAGLAPWESSLVIRAGDTLRVGPIVLGQADGRLLLHTRPTGASVSIERTLRGHTPLDLAVASGIEHEVMLALPGYETWTRTVLAQPSSRLRLDVTLKPILFDVSVRGEPQDAEILVDGESKGYAPQTLSLLAIDHRIELRKPGFVPLITDVAPAADLERSVTYRLMPSPPTAGTSGGE
jgi:PEGA domain